ncbi:hypothetical protein CRENBAI_005936 [Crenichthys baileyi]|uniref:Uncharacterized protein n=1 Tax=Crenichthys baileyi TaxID=28760 RepID=A0AAV9R3B1_9TELE
MGFCAFLLICLSQAELGRVWAQEYKGPSSAEDDPMHRDRHRAPSPLGPATSPPLALQAKPNSQFPRQPRARANPPAEGETPPEAPTRQAATSSMQQLEPEGTKIGGAHYVLPWEVSLLVV